MFFKQTKMRPLERERLRTRVLTKPSDEEVLSKSSLENESTGCCASCRRPSKVFKTFMPLIRHPQVRMTDFQRTWMKNSYLRYMKRIDRQSLDARQKFKNIRRSLIILGVIISALIILSRTTYVQDSPDAIAALFWVSMFISVCNNFVTAFLTDLKLAEQAILFYRGSAYLQAMGQTFLTCTQRYSCFATCEEGFRTFVRDVEMSKLLITSEDISLMSSSKEQEPTDEIVRDRQSWSTLLSPLDLLEAKRMGEMEDMDGPINGPINGPIDRPLDEGLSVRVQVDDENDGLEGIPLDFTNEGGVGIDIEANKTQKPEPQLEEDS